MRYTSTMRNTATNQSSKPGDLIGFHVIATARNGFVESHRVDTTAEVAIVRDAYERPLARAAGFTVATHPIFYTYACWLADRELAA